MKILRACLVGMLAVSASTQVGRAEVPRVAADIGPVASLVARVMKGVDGASSISQVIRTGASPHGYAMRPSEAAALEQSDAVFWIGPELTPWLGEAITTLAPDASVTALLQAPGTEVLEFRAGPRFDHGGHGEHEHGDDEHDEHEHDEHAHDHADEHGHDEHGDDEHGHDEHGHDHSGADPHAWLDPDNAAAWLDVIAADLARLDPANAEAYRANAEAGQAEIAAAENDVRAILEPVRGARFVVFHDAYHYFEHHFDFPAAGAISAGDASDPGPARLEEVQGLIRELDVQCALSEPALNPGFVRTVTEGTGARLGTVDPLGADIEPGAEFYPALLRGMATRLVECAS